MLQQWLTLLADNPALRLLQIAMLILGVIAVFLVCFATRDILLRTQSFLLQILCILLVAFLPIIGYLIYLLIRPARTVKEREMERMVQAIFQFTEDAEILEEEAGEEVIEEVAEDDSADADTDEIN